MEQNKKTDGKQYTKAEMKKILLHRIVLFILVFFVLSASALKPILSLYPSIGILICLFLSALMSYFMSFTLYEYSKTKGIWVYVLVIGVVIIMLLRYK